MSDDLSSLDDRCLAVYDRLLPGARQPEYVQCTYLTGHEARHSWETLKQNDDEARVRERTLDDALDEAPSFVREIILDITAGRVDDWIEAILAAGHDRKRTKRGVKGFRRGDRTLRS